MKKKTMALFMALAMLMTSIQMPVSAAGLTPDTEEILPEAAALEVPVEGEEVSEVKSAEPETDVEEEAGQADGSSFASALEISIGDEKVVSADDSDSYTYFKFTAPENGAYSFYSKDNGESDPIAELYDAEEYVSENDDDEGLNFRLTCIMQAGEVYYLKAWDRNESADSYTVCVEKEKLYIEYEGECSVKPGQDVTLAVTVFSEEAVTYQWSDENGDLIEGAEAAEYTVKNISKPAEYYCTVTSGEDIKSAYFYIEIDNEFTLDYEENYAVEPGNTVNLTVNAAVESGNLSYQWYEYKWDDYYEEYDYVLIEGQTGNTLTIADIRTNKEYRCTVRDEYGNTKSAYFEVTVDSGFTLEDNESDILVDPGETAEMEVKAAVKVGNLTYQWYDGADNLLEGKNTAKLDIENCVEDQEYYCEVKDDYGNTKIARFYIAIDNYVSIDYEREHLIQPGDSVDLTVNAETEFGKLSYQWYEYNQDDYEDILIEGQTDNTLTLSDITRSKEYSCTVSDEYGNSKTANFSVVVDAGLTMENHGSDICVKSGGTAELEVKAAVKMGSLNYQWYDENDEKLEGETAAKLTVANCTEGQGYCCEVTDDYGNLEVAWFNITIKDNITIDNDYESYYEVAPDSPVTLKVSAAAEEGGLTYQWYEYDGKEDYLPITGETRADFVIPKVTEYKEYKCMIEDEFGGCEDVYITVTVDSGFTVLQEYYNGRTVSYGEDIELVTDARVVIGSLAYEWYMYDSENDQKVLIKNETGSSIVLPKVKESGSYICEIHDDYGNTNSIRFYVNVENIVLEYQPDYKVKPGENVNLKVDAQSVSGNLTYQWAEYSKLRNNYKKIKGETSETLTVSNVSEYKEYKCEVRDVLGNESTAYFTVEVDSGFSVPKENITLTVLDGETVELNPEAQVKLGDLTYKWYYDYDLLKDETGSTLTVTVNGNYENYMCEVEDEYGHSEEVWFYLELKESVYKVKLNGSAKLEAKPQKLTGKLTYEWYEYNEKGQNYELLEGKNESTLTVSDVTEYKKYQCIIKDGSGNEECLLFAAAVDSGLQIEGDLERTVMAKIGSPMELKVQAHADIGAVSYQWKWLGYKGWIPVKGETASSFKLSKVYSYVTYACYVEDDFGRGEDVIFRVTPTDVECTHDWGTGVVTKAATCTETGILTYTCSKCMATRTEDIPKNDSHTWENWKTTAAATVFSAEKQNRVCSACKKKEERTVGKKLAPTMKLTAASLKMQQKQKTTKFKVTGLVAGDYVKSWKSSSKKVLKATGKKDGSCTLKAKKAGKAVITITLASGLKKTVSVKVQKKQVKTASIQGLSKNVKLKKGKKLKLAPVLNPITSQDKITYVSSNKKVAAVSAKGLIKAKKAGKAKITVKAGKKKFVMKVVVK